MAGIVQMVAIPLAVAGQKNVALQRDAAALTLYSPGLIEAINETAKTDERLAALLDKILAVGPYGLIFAAAMPLILQILVNHGAMPGAMAEAAGVMSVEQLDAQLGIVVGDQGDEPATDSAE